jgi:hypothetical protein
MHGRLAGGAPMTRKKAMHQVMRTMEAVGQAYQVGSEEFDDQQLKAIQALFRVPMHLEPIEGGNGGSYLYYTENHELIGWVPEDSSGGFYEECCCSGLTGDPNGVYCKGECFCGACDDHHDDGWKPGMTREQAEAWEIERIKQAYALCHLDIKTPYEEQNPGKGVVDLIMERLDMGESLATYIADAVETDQVPLDQLIEEVLNGEAEGYAE